MRKTSLLSVIADRFILCPSTNPVDFGVNDRRIIDSQNGIEIEVFESSFGNPASAPDGDPKNELVIMKFPGTSGRAERASIHPGELLTGTDKPFSAAYVVTLNHRGYGKSTGPASLSNFVTTLHRFKENVSDRFPNATVLAAGNSLGCMSAIYCAANFRIDGLLLRNPPPLKQLISQRWKYTVLGLGFNRIIAAQIPDELDVLNNAKRITCPGLFVCSEKDRVVPLKFQEMVINSFAGIKKQFVIQGADHHHPIHESQRTEYWEAVEWLGTRIS